MLVCVNDRGTCRVSKDLYAPALGGIMLSIGIKLSIDDFALAVKRFKPCRFVCFESDLKFLIEILLLVADLCRYPLPLLHNTF